MKNNVTSDSGPDQQIAVQKHARRFGDSLGMV